MELETIERIETRDIEPLSMRASFQPGSADVEKRTVDIIWTTGARVLRGFYDRFWEELSLNSKHVRMARLQSGRAPFLGDHYRGINDVLGVIESARIEKDEKGNLRGVATVRFPKAEDDPEADRIFRKIVDGILTNVSVGYRVYRFEKVEDGEDKIPVMRATDWEPYEVSLVGIGADAGAGTRSAETAEARPCEFIFREEKAMENDTNTQPKPKVDPGPSVDDAARSAAEEATRKERERVTGISQTVRKAGLDEKLAEDLIGRGVSLDEARKVVLDKLAEKNEQTRTEQHTRIEVGEDEHEKFRKGAEATIFQRAMVADTIRKAQKTDIAGEILRDVDLSPGNFARMSMLDIARACLERRGVKTSGMDKMRVFGEALTYRSGLNTTSDFAILLESAMYKTLLAAYATTPDTWRRFCAVRSNPDFRDQTFYRNGSFGTLDAINEHGEFKHKSIPDGEKTSIGLGTKGNIIGISRKALINDDMGAFNDLATRFGRAAALSIETDVYSLIKQNAGLGPTLNDGKTLFHADHANISTGAALSVDALDADRVMLAVQKDVSKNETLALTPAVLLLPIGLGGQARVINEAQYDVSVTSKFQVPNKVRGIVRDIVDVPHLTGTRRYLLADKDIAPVFVVTFLEGQQTPILETKEGWNVDGTEWKVRIDYGVAAVDFRGAVTNAGVA